jgi:hypothetical protein
MDAIKAPGEPRPLPVLHISERVVQSRGLKRTYAQLGRVPYVVFKLGSVLMIAPDIDIPATPPVPRPMDCFQLLLQLDSAVRPGVSEAHFRALFARCTCGLVMTRRAIKAHYCMEAITARDAEVIDLTETDTEADE